MNITARNLVGQDTIDLSGVIGMSNPGHDYEDFIESLKELGPHIAGVTKAMAQDARVLGGEIARDIVKSGEKLELGTPEYALADNYANLKAFQKAFPGEKDGPVAETMAQLVFLAFIAKLKNDTNKSPAMLMKIDRLTILGLGH